MKFLYAALMLAGIFKIKISKIQGSCIEDPYKISLQHTKCYKIFPAICKMLQKFSWNMENLSKFPCNIQNLTKIFLLSAKSCKFSSSKFLKILKQCILKSFFQCCEILKPPLLLLICCMPYPSCSVIERSPCLCKTS